MSKRDIKILSISTSDSGGGAAKAAYRIHKSVCELGVESRLIVKQKSTDDTTVIPLDNYVPDGVLNRAVDWVRNKVKNRIQHYRWNKYPERDDVFMSDLRGTSLYGAIRNTDYDILHLHWINLRFISLDQLPKDKPIVWTLHDSWPFCGICHYFLECDGYKGECGNCPFLHSDQANDLSHKIWKEKERIYRNLDMHIVCPSRWMADSAKASGLFRNSHITVIPNCIDENTFLPLDTTDSESRLSILYGAVNATKDRIKGFANLLSALKVLEQRGYADKVELIVFGANESDLSIDLKIPVRYMGYINTTQELVSLYNHASVMVVPSLTENLSCTIMESLSCGTPVVAFNVGGNGDLIEHQKNGYLARYKDDEDLAAGILWCIENNRSGQLGQAARESVLNKYTYRTVGEQYKALYESLSKH